MRGVLVTFRLGFGLLILIATGRQLAIQLEFGLSLVQFFSFFTILSNLFAAFVLLAAGVRLVRHAPASATADRLRHYAVIYMTVVGVVFVTLLRNADLGPLLAWVNTVLHYVSPVLVFVDWLIDRPRWRLTMGDLSLASIFPLAYLVYSLVRGAITGWYPYPFLSPSLVGGYGVVGLYAVGILLVFSLIGGLLMTAPRVRRDLL